MAVSGDRALDSRLEPRDSRFGFCDGAGVGSGVGAALCDGAGVGSGVGAALCDGAGVDGADVVFCAAELALCVWVFPAEAAVDCGCAEEMLSVAVPL